ncbi:uncharacterized protein RAG0_03841 [Rhynchosporium agropyri]|uniref:Uncharacterized protein n=1 Tax=Rhynchosporium agropyri TaxID=914238 RepID=A0A1E1K6M0_9HELO|nr:uncharacterized protein RAG0_03841 [Rhynchosporium agropyri]
MASNPQIMVNLGCFALEFEPSASPAAPSQDTDILFVDEVVLTVSAAFA